MKKKWNLYIVLILLVGMIATGYFFHLKEEYELSEFGKKTKGEIVDIYSIPNRGYYVKYVYYVDKKKYEGNTTVQGKVENYNIGDVFEVIYSEKNPKYKEINFNKVLD